MTLRTVTPRREEGQSLLEMTVGTVFLLIIVVILFEMGMLFYTYIALLNAAREGSVFASLHPDLAPGSDNYEEYLTVTSQEALAAGLDLDLFEILPPETPEGREPLKPILVTVRYQLINPTHGIILPFVGRFGLFQQATITARTEMPIR
jgi:hypothetical protein